MKPDDSFNKVELTARQKKQMQSVLKEIYEDDPKIDPQVSKGMLSWAKGITVRIADLFERKKRVNDTYEFFRPYYDLVGLKLTKKDAASIRYNVVTLAKKMRQIADEKQKEIENE